MIFNKEKKEQKNLVAVLQGEDDVFHRTIIALERLELCLGKERHGQVVGLSQTAIGTSRDYHDGSSLDREECFLELLLQCKTLYMNAHYKEKEFFDIAVEAFMKNLLEWYAGRQFLGYYDEVDAAIIPVLIALSHKDIDIDAVFEKYVHVTPKMEQLSVEEKFNATQEGVVSWIKGQWLLNEERNKKMVHAEGEESITSHERGAAIDGFKRAITALTAMFSESAPAKMALRMMKEYLPEVANQLPNITEDAIDEIFVQKKVRTLTGGESENKATSAAGVEKMKPLSNSDPLRKEIEDAVAAILEKDGIPYSDVSVTINININID